MGYTGWVGDSEVGYCFAEAGPGSLAGDKGPVRGCLCLPPRQCLMLYNMSYKNVEYLGIDEFRRKVSAAGLSELLAGHGAVEVGRYHKEATAIVVEPHLFADLSETKEHWESLKTTLPLLLAAVRTGTANPSETLADGYLARRRFVASTQLIASSIPVRFTANEDGGPISRAHFTPQAQIMELDQKSSI